MVRIGRILRDYQDAGSVNGLLALWGFVDETTFLTKAGHVGVVYRIRGVDYEGLSHPQRQALAHRFEAGLRLLDEHCRVYQYLLKRIVAPFTSGKCLQPIANEAIQRRAARKWDGWAISNWKSNWSKRGRNWWAHPAAQDQSGAAG